MTKIKLCGLSRACDMIAVNELMPEYVGFVFAKNSSRYVDPQTAAALRKQLPPSILPVGVFVMEEAETVAELLNSGIIDMAQLHGGEDENYIRQLRRLTGKPLIKAFWMEAKQDVIAAQESTADYILLDSGSGGSGTVFDWTLLRHMERPYFLAGGLNAANVKEALQTLAPYAVDVSSGIETKGRKDAAKMKEFVRAVRGV